MSAQPSQSVRRVPLHELVFDRAMQCRASLVESVVAEYADAIKAGAVFPPLEAVEVEGRLLVVDGFHRGAAYRAAASQHVDVVVSVGTRRDALLRAVAANSTHGLQRTNLDKRRAVEVLLMDEEWCKLSGRELAGLAGVTHTYINQLRTYFCVERGEVLTASRLSEITGELPPRWRQLVEKTPEWGRKEVEACRAAKTPVHLIRAAGEGTFSSTREARDLRARELAVGAWPWADEDRTEEARLERWRHLDTVDDIAAACASLVCPVKLEEAYELLRVAVTLPVPDYRPDRERVKLEGRPKLLDAWDKKSARKAAKSGTRADYPWERAQKVEAAATMEAQHQGIEELDEDALHYVAPRRLQPAVRDGIFRARVAPGNTAACPDPCCEGWIIPETKQRRASCAICGASPDHWHDGVARELQAGGRWLVRPGVGAVFTARLGERELDVRVTRHALRLLALLDQVDPESFLELPSRQLGPAQLAELRDVWEQWAADTADRVEVDLRPAHRRPPEGEEEEGDQGEEEDLDEEGLDEDEDAAEAS